MKLESLPTVEVVGTVNHVGPSTENSCRHRRPHRSGFLRVQIHGTYRPMTQDGNPIYRVTREDDEKPTTFDFVYADGGACAPPTWGDQVYPMRWLRHCRN